MGLSPGTHFRNERQEVPDIRRNQHPALFHCESQETLIG